MISISFSISLNLFSKKRGENYDHFEAHTQSISITSISPWRQVKSTYDNFSKLALLNKVIPVCFYAGLSYAYTRLAAWTPRFKQNIVLSGI